MKKITVTFLFLAALAGIAWAAYDPPVVGDVSILEFTTYVNTATWTLTGQKDGVLYNMSTVGSFVNISAFKPGASRISVKWKQAGHYLVKGSPSVGIPQYYAVDVQPTDPATAVWGYAGRTVTVSGVYVNSTTVSDGIARGLANNTTLRAIKRKTDKLPNYWK